MGGAAASPPPPRRSPAFSLPLREVGGPGSGPATCYGPHTPVSRAPFKLPLTARPRPVRGPLRPGFRRLLWSWKTPDCSRLRASLAHSARPHGIVKDLRPRGVGARQPSADGEEDREVRSSGLAERNTELELNRGKGRRWQRPRGSERRSTSQQSPRCHLGTACPQARSCSRGRVPVAPGPRASLAAEPGGRTLRFGIAPHARALRSHPGRGLGFWGVQPQTGPRRCERLAQMCST